MRIGSAWAPADSWARCRAPPARALGRLLAPLVGLSTGQPHARDRGLALDRPGERVLAVIPCISRCRSRDGRVAARPAGWCRAPLPGPVRNYSLAGSFLAMLTSRSLAWPWRALDGRAGAIEGYCLARESPAGGVRPPGCWGVGGWVVVLVVLSSVLRVRAAGGIRGFGPAFVAQRGLDAGGPPACAAAHRRFALGVEGVGDGLEGHAAGAHGRDALDQFGSVADRGPTRGASLAGGGQALAGAFGQPLAFPSADRSQRFGDELPAVR